MARAIQSVTIEVWFGENHGTLKRTIEVAWPEAKPPKITDLIRSTADEMIASITNDLGDV